MSRLVDRIPEIKPQPHALDIHAVGRHTVAAVTRARGCWRIACSCGTSSPRIDNDHDACVWWYEHANERSST